MPVPVDVTFPTRCNTGVNTPHSMELFCTYKLLIDAIPESQFVGMLLVSWLADRSKAVRAVRAL